MKCDNSRSVAKNGISPGHQVQTIWRPGGHYSSDFRACAYTGQQSHEINAKYYKTNPRYMLLTSSPPLLPTTLGSVVSRRSVSQQTFHMLMVMSQLKFLPPLQRVRPCSPLPFAHSASDDIPSAQELSNLLPRTTARHSLDALYAIN